MTYFSYIPPLHKILDNPNTLLLKLAARKQCVLLLVCLTLLFLGITLKPQVILLPQARGKTGVGKKLFEPCTHSVLLGNPIMAGENEGGENTTVREVAVHS